MPAEAPRSRLGVGVDRLVAERAVDLGLEQADVLVKVGIASATSRKGSFGLPHARATRAIGLPSSLRAAASSQPPPQPQSQPVRAWRNRALPGAARGNAGGRRESPSHRGRRRRWNRWRSAARCCELWRSMGSSFAPRAGKLRRFWRHRWSKCSRSVAHGRPALLDPRRSAADHGVRRAAAEQLGVRVNPGARHAEHRRERLGVHEPRRDRLLMGTQQIENAPRDQVDVVGVQARATARVLGFALGFARVGRSFVRSAQRVAVRGSRSVTNGRLPCRRSASERRV